MMLPINIKQLEEVINNTSGVIDQQISTSSFYNIDNEVAFYIQKLEEYRKIARNNATKMLELLGYSGSLEQMQAELNKRISDLQKGTSFLNGQELEDFIIKELRQATPYSIDNQRKYEEFLKETFNKEVNEIFTGDNIDRIGFAEQIMKQLGENTEVIFSDKGDRVLIRNKQGKFGSFQQINFSSQFTKLNKSLQDRLQKKVFSKLKDREKNDVNINENSIESTFSIPSTEDNLTAILRLTKDRSRNSKRDITISDLQKLDPEIIIKIKKAFKNKILSGYNGNYRGIFESSIDQVLNNNGIEKILFSGNNAVKNITGLLGEIQGLYYVKVITGNKEDISVSWNAAELSNSRQSHADLILKKAAEQYGIQVKNTVLEQAKAITFESFTGKPYSQNGSLEIKFNKESDKYFSLALDQNTKLFEAIATALGMEQFNVEYQTINQQAVRHSNRFFKPYIRMIKSVADHGRKAVNTFAGAMMYMAIDEEYNKLKPNMDQYNTLYLIAGKQVITSAQILSDIIDNLEKDIMHFNVIAKTKYLKKDFNPENKGGPTIVEYKNNGIMPLINLSAEYLF